MRSAQWWTVSTASTVSNDRAGKGRASAAAWTAGTEPGGRWGDHDGGWLYRNDLAACWFVRARAGADVQHAAGSQRRDDEPRQPGIFLAAC